MLTDHKQNAPYNTHHEVLMGLAQVQLHLQGICLLLERSLYMHNTLVLEWPY